MTMESSIVLHTNPYEFDFQTYARWHPSLLGSFKRWLAKLHQQRRVRREIQCLHEMSDHLLQDIGLTRADLSDDGQFKNAAKLRSDSQG
jgi:uncharacterized protein YjiS (DUF1127 family)